MEKLDEVFVPLTAYVESLSHLEELPDRILTSNISGSIFAEAYNLQKLLGENDAWEPIPFNIPGIYDKTILPHIRANNKNSLMSAWDKRIEQQKRLVLFFEDKKKEALRGLDREDKRRQRNRQEGQGGIMRSHDLDDFNRITLPNLYWSKMKDMFTYIDQLEGAKQMLKFVQDNLATPNGEQFFDDFINILDGSQNEGEDTTETPAGSA